MIDTLRLTGDADYYKFSYDYERFVGYHRKDGTEYITETLVENKKDKNGNSLYRAYYTPSKGQITVELNPQKIMFQNNIYNYEHNPAILSTFIRDIASHFFRGGDCYISRIDLGGVREFPNYTETIDVLERIKATRLPGAKLAKQVKVYQYSAFYPFEYCSIKVYHKGHEMKLKEDTPESIIEGLNLMNTLRFEKTYRFREMERLGVNYAKSFVTPQIIGFDGKPLKSDRGRYLSDIAKAKKNAPFQVVPYKGVHIDSFDIEILIKDFYSIFTGWVLKAVPYMTNRRGTAGLLSVIDNAGLISEIEGKKIVSRTSIYRYNKLKKQRDFSDVEHVVKFEKNMSNKIANLWYYYRTFGLQSALQ